MKNIEVFQFQNKHKFSVVTVELLLDSAENLVLKLVWN